MVLGKQKEETAVKAAKMRTENWPAASVTINPCESLLRPFGFRIAESKAILRDTRIIQFTKSWEIEVFQSLWQFKTSTVQSF